MVKPTSDYLKPISFLIVDDKSYMRRVVKSVLETLGARQLEDANDGSEALAKARAWQPDIILTEWRLFPMTGLELLKAVRAERGNIRFTPIVMITSETRREKVIQARNTGITEFVAKPFNAKSLLLRIKEIIERPRPYVDVGAYFGPDRRRRTEVMAEGGERRGQGGPKTPEPQSTVPRGMTQEQIDRLVAGDNIREH